MCSSSVADALTAGLPGGRTGPGQRQLAWQPGVMQELSSLKLGFEERSEVGSSRAMTSGQLVLVGRVLSPVALHRECSFQPGGLRGAQHPWRWLSAQQQPGHDCDLSLPTEDSDLVSEETSAPLKGRGCSSNDWTWRPWGSVILPTAIGSVAPLTSGAAEMLRQCHPEHGLEQRWGQQKRVLTSLTSSQPGQAHSHQPPKFPSFPESPAARDQPLPGSQGTLRPGACVSVCLSPLAIFQESRRDLRAADSAS